VRSPTPAKRLVMSPAAAWGQWRRSGSSAAVAAATASKVGGRRRSAWSGWPAGASWALRRSKEHQQRAEGEDRHDEREREGVPHGRSLVCHARVDRGEGPPNWLPVRVQRRPGGGGALAAKCTARSPRRRSAGGCPDTGARLARGPSTAPHGGAVEFGPEVPRGEPFEPHKGGAPALWPGSGLFWRTRRRNSYRGW
jgi:hypothetical protein